MRGMANLLIASFNPSGSLLFDIVLPAVAMATCGALLTQMGLISENTALWGFLVGALIHVLLSWIAVFLMQGRKREKCHREAGSSNR